MKLTKKKLLCAVLALCMAVALCACSTDGKNQTEELTVLFHLRVQPRSQCIDSKESQIGFQLNNEVR